MKTKKLLKTLCFKFNCILETNKNIDVARVYGNIIEVHPDLYRRGLVGLFIILHEIDLCA